MAAKLVCNVNNFGVLGLPSWLEKYNAKPVLVRNAGKVYKVRNAKLKVSHFVDSYVLGFPEG
jgi:hypothetical protein